MKIFLIFFLIFLVSISTYKNFDYQSKIIILTNQLDSINQSRDSFKVYPKNYIIHMWGMGYLQGISTMSNVNDVKNIFRRDSEMVYKSIR